ncbi:MAG: protein-L-isoaspartate O-methyltransferase [Burkholderiaceae bacterium]|nr:MAG: protein-L-isoaspartate O-methyltransferase [Burkholderiaceae bacterium]
MNIEQSRFNMVEQQIRPWDVLNPEVLSLLFVVKREEFVPAAYRALAFSDLEIPLPEGETMFAPKLEARILQELALQPHESVLEVGAGSGYLAALLAYQADHVTTYEIKPALQTLAQQNLARAEIKNVTVVAGDGLQTHDETQYDAIVLSGSLPELPQQMLQRLRVGGRLLSFIGTAPVLSAQLTTRTSAEKFATRKLFETYVKPLVGAEQFSHFKF